MIRAKKYSSSVIYSEDTHKYWETILGLEFVVLI